MIYCECGGGFGSRPFTNLASNGGQWWVCSLCLRPTMGWLMGQGDELLNYFKGGLLDGYAYETITLIQTPHHVGHIPITEYSWTEEIVTSERTQRRARVWVHKSLLDGNSDSVSQATVAPQMTTGGSPDAQPLQGERKKMAKSTVMQDSGNGLVNRRTELGLSRRIVAEAAGITQAQLGTLEKGGARTTEEAVANVHNALNRLAENAPAAAQPAEPVVADDTAAATQEAQPVADPS